MAPNIETYYRILELPLNAPNDDIRVRYRQMARVYHPDRYNDPVDKEFVEAMMKRVNEAYNTLIHTPRPHTTQVAPPPQAPTIYRTVKGIPTVMAIVLTGVAFIFGAITVQLFSSNILSHETLAQTALALEASPLAGEQCISQTVASATTVAIAVAEKVIESEPLAVEVSGIGLFPLRSSETKPSQAPVVEPIAPVAPTDTPVATPTSIPTDTPAPMPTNTPTDVPPPSPTAQPPTPTNIIQTDAGVLYIINNPYSVYARTATSIQSAPAGLLVAGQQVLLTGRTGDNYWLRVVLEGERTAWIYAESAGANNELLSALPIVNP